MPTTTQARPLAVFLCIAAASALAGCPTDEPAPLDEIAWDPALSSSNGGELDLGEVERGSSTQGSITGTNQTDRDITFEIEVDLPVGEGFIGTSPSDPFVVEPGDQVSYGPRFNPNNNTPDEVEGTVTFYYEDQVVTYLVSAEAVDPD
jgi:hypothetical protein